MDSNDVMRVWVGDEALSQEVDAFVQALEVVRGVSGARRKVPTARVVARAAYSFSLLASVRDRISAELLGMHTGIVAVHVAEAANRVSVGVLESHREGARQALEASLSKDALPIDAVQWYSTGLAQLDVGVPRAGGATRASLNQTLTDPHDPALGGIRQLGPCTIGMIVSRQGELGTVSSSHCSPTTFGLDDGYALYAGDIYHLLARESVDPAPLGMQDCGPFIYIPCRYSDAAFSTIEDTANVRRGAVARPLSYVSAWGTNGTLVVDTTLRFFAVTSVATSGTVEAGDYLMKVGQTTGWSEGEVLETCADRLFTDNKKRLCLIVSEYYASGSDSGAPVFFGSAGNNIMLVGVHAGSNPDLQIAYASHWHHVEEELGGPLNALTDITIAAPSPDGDWPSGMPELTWTAVATTNTILATTYRVYRSTFDSILGWTEWDALVETTASLTYTDANRFVDHYYGANVPPSGTSYVRYVVSAESHGVVNASARLYFRTTGAQ